MADNSQDQDQPDALTLYPNFGHFHTRIEEIEFNLPVEADLTSVKIEGNRHFDIATFESHVTVVQGAEKYRGEILESGDKSVTLRIPPAKEGDSSKEVKIYHPDKIEYKSPRLHQNLTLKSPIKGSIGLSYIIRPATATLFYCFDLADKTLVQLLLTQMPFSFEGLVTLMVGDIHVQRRFTETRKMAAQATRPRSTSSDSEVELLPATSDVDEYKAVEVGNIYLEEGIMTQSLQDWKKIDFTKYYINILTQADVRTVYSFVAPKFLAAGSCRVDRGPFILGESNISETQPNKPVLLVLGKTSRILVKTVITKPSSKQSSYGSSTEDDVTINSEIDNLTGETTNLRLEYFVGQAQMTRVNASLEVQSTKADISPIRETNNIYFMLNLKPGKSLFKANFHLKY